MKKLSSLSIFFPFFNDAGTVKKAVELAFAVGGKVTSDLEVIALHGGPSVDKTWNEILSAKKSFPKLKIIDKRDNTEGYAVIKHGFAAATKEWIFYTDGDLQYDVNELTVLVDAQAKTGADVVNGYKKNRSDSPMRRFFGKLYQQFSNNIFHLPIRDLDCDFRLIRGFFLKNTTFSSQSASILAELILHLKHHGAKFAEVPVTHLPRKYGKSNYRWWELLIEKLIGDIRLFWIMRISQQNPGKSHS